MCQMNSNEKAYGSFQENADHDGERIFGGGSAAEETTKEHDGEDGDIFVVNHRETTTTKKQNRFGWIIATITLATFLLLTGYRLQSWKAASIRARNENGVGLRTSSTSSVSASDTTITTIDTLDLPLNMNNNVAEATALTSTSDMFEVLPWELVRVNNNGTATTNGGEEEDDYYYVGYLELCDGDGKGGSYGYRTWDASERNNKYGVALDERPCGVGPAPLIRMVPGRNYKIVFLNNAHIATNLHTHGLHVAGVGQGDDVTRTAEPGKCLAYHYRIRDDADVGTFFYHSHIHPISNEQVGGGAYGLLIVDETPDTLDNYYPNHVSQFLQNEVLLQFFSRRNAHNRTLHDRTVNGRDTLAVNLVREEYYYVRISVVDMNSAVTYVEFSPPNACESRVVAYDGVYRSRVPHEEPSNKHMVTLSSRLDLAVSCVDDATITYYAKDPTEPDAVTVAIRTIQQHSSSSSNNDMGTTPEIVSSPYWDATEKTQWSPRRPYYMPDLMSVSSFSSERQEVVERVDLSMDDVVVYGQKTVAINNELWDKTEPLWSFPLDTILEMDLYNTHKHPIHFHINHMQIVEPGGCGPRYEEGEYYDTITAAKSLPSCRVRMQFFDFAGRVIAHCHVLKHEDRGMMFWVDVTGGPEHGVQGYHQVECSRA